ncbi:putative FMN-binding regulatory protein PaiB [Microbacterium sp. SORGH_AS428]|nr:putative FMN-binding regulatory protein PaiB [Microbacterium sp. SORGH_AS_0428]
MLDRLVERFESPMPAPRRMWERPNDADFVHRLERGTVGFRLTPSSVVAKRKLSQNRPAEVVDHIVDMLRADGPHSNLALADEMARARRARREA